MTMPPIGLGPATSVYTETHAVPPWPKPEIAGHEVSPDYLGKSAVIGLARRAVDAGWKVKVTHAKGSYPTTGGRPGPARDSLAVRMWRGDQRAVAVYVAGNKTWDWKLCRMWRIGQFPDVLGFTAFEQRML